LTDKLVGRLEGPGKSAYREIEAISLEAHAEKKGYNHSPYLVYIAAQCYSQPARVVPMQLGPGQGKSYVCYMLARRYAQDEADVAIVVHSGPA
jgi:hypothetical protein